MFFFVQGAQELDLVRNPAFFDDSVRRFNKAKLVHAGIGAQRDDQADVRSLWGLNGTNASIVCGMHIPDLKACTFPRQSTRAQRT